MLVGRLPSMGGSRFVAAQRADPDALDHLLDLPEAQQKRWRPADAEWDQKDELLAKILDALGDLTAVAASHPLPKKVKAKKPPPRHARPLRGIDLAKARRRNRYIAELENEVAEAQARWVAENPNHAPVHSEADGQAMLDRAVRVAGLRKPSPPDGSI